MKKAGLIVLSSGVALAVLAFGLHSPMTQQGHAFVTQEIAQGIPEGGPPQGNAPHDFSEEAE